jgi:hypothetical protein
LVTELQKTRLPFTGTSGLQKPVNNVMMRFLLFVDKEVIDFIVQETNRYAVTVVQSCTLKPRSQVKNWQPVTGEEICAPLGIYVLMSIMQKPSMKSYISRDAFTETPIFNQMVLQDRFCLISKLTPDTYCGPPKLFRIHSIIEMLRQCFQSA